MALINASLQVPTYTSDFGKVFTNLAVKFGNDVPAGVIAALGYVVRTVGIVCSSTNRFSPRHLVVTMTTGAKHILPVNRDQLTAAVVAALKAAGVVCIDLIGESYTLLAPAEIGSPTYSTTTGYSNIPSLNAKTSYVYNYVSDVFLSGISARIAIETLPAATLAAQLHCLDNPVVSSGGVCSSVGLGLTPRRLILKHNALKTAPAKNGVVSRYVNVSSDIPADLITCANATEVAGAALCLAYMGESVKGVESIL